MFTEVMRLDKMDDIAIDGLDYIPAENRISKVERKLQLTFESVLDKVKHRDGYLLLRKYEFY